MPSPYVRRAWVGAPRASALSLRAVELVARRAARNHAWSGTHGAAAAIPVAAAAPLRPCALAPSPPVPTPLAAAMATPEKEGQFMTGTTAKIFDTAPGAGAERDVNVASCPPTEDSEAASEMMEEGKKPFWKIGGTSMTSAKKRKIQRQATQMPEEELEAQRHGTWVSSVFHIITAVM